MKLLHIADLHIGKRVKGFSLIEDQKVVLEQILNVAKKEKVNGIIIAGDIYDISNPSNEALNLFDSFISELNDANIACYAVSGNHDSVYRVSFGASVMSKSNIYFAKKFNGKIDCINIDKNTCIWLLPFIRPCDVREFYPNFQISSYQEMIEQVISGIEIDKSKINILVAHQFITFDGVEPDRSDSESISLGTLENIDYSVFKDFNYVALGHIHKPQYRGNAVYSGSILKYSFSEKHDNKSMVLLEINDNKLNTTRILYEPIRDMVEIKGTYKELREKDICNDYVRLVLTDEDFIPDIKHKLSANFTNIMEIAYDNTFTRENKKITNIDINTQLTPFELYKKFYEIQNNRSLNEQQENVVKKIFEELK